jgi:hypothetical protein
MKRLRTRGKQTLAPFSPRRRLRSKRCGWAWRAASAGPDGGIGAGLAPEEFRAFHRNGYAKAVWNLSFARSDGGTQLSAETRVQTFGGAATMTFRPVLAGRWPLFRLPSEGHAARGPTGLRAILGLSEDVSQPEFPAETDDPRFPTPDGSCSCGIFLPVFLAAGLETEHNAVGSDLR